VVATVSEPTRVGLTYATLPGHPETGVEQFLFVQTADGLRFEVRAVSRPTAWYSRILPALTARIQAEQTQRYLDAAAALLSGA